MQRKVSHALFVLLNIRSEMPIRNQAPHSSAPIRTRPTRRKKPHGSFDVTTKTLDPLAAHLGGIADLDGMACLADARDATDRTQARARRCHGDGLLDRGGARSRRAGGKTARRCRK